MYLEWGGTNWKYNMPALHRLSNQTVLETISLDIWRVVTLNIWIYGSVQCDHPSLQLSSMYCLIVPSTQSMYCIIMYVPFLCTTWYMCIYSYLTRMPASLPDFFLHFCCVAVNSNNEYMSYAAILWCDCFKLQPRCWLAVTASPKHCES